MDGVTPITVLISGRGSNMESLARACSDGRLPARLVRVISDQPTAPGLQVAQALGIPVAVVSKAGHASRESYDEQLLQEVEADQPRYVALAGFMRILTPAFARHFAGRLVNIHPSLLPAYKGLHTHERVLAAGERRHGASVHFVSAGLDEGPVLAQGSINVEAGDTAQSLAARLLAVEHRLYPAALALLVTGRVQLDGTQILLDGEPLAAPLVEPWS